MSFWSRLLSFFDSSHNGDGYWHPVHFCRPSAIFIVFVKINFHAIAVGFITAEANAGEIAIFFQFLFKVLN